VRALPKAIDNWPLWAARTLSPPKLATSACEGSARTHHRKKADPVIPDPTASCGRTGSGFPVIRQVGGFDSSESGRPWCGDLRTSYTRCKGSRAACQWCDHGPEPIHIFGGGGGAWIAPPATRRWHSDPAASRTGRRSPQSSVLRPYLGAARTSMPARCVAASGRQTARPIGAARSRIPAPRRSGSDGRMVSRLRRARRSRQWLHSEPPPSRASRRLAHPAPAARTQAS